MDAHYAKQHTCSAVTGGNAARRLRVPEGAKLVAALRTGIRVHRPYLTRAEVHHKFGATYDQHKAGYADG